jgi:hypothetical protein
VWVAVIRIHHPVEGARGPVAAVDPFGDERQIVEAVVEKAAVECDELVLEIGLSAENAK